MRTIYLDRDYKCHLQHTEGRTAIETEFFDGKCDAFIEGYRYVPAGKTWTREDGTVFHGGMIAPWRDYSVLVEFQAQNETMTAELVDAKAALAAIYEGAVE